MRDLIAILVYSAAGIGAAIIFVIEGHYACALWPLSGIVLAWAWLSIRQDYDALEEQARRIISEVNEQWEAGE